jgi:glycosyltransferase A (GT-A) superfamily protein (DUF2064 family)
VPAGVEVVAQGGGGLGDRLAAAFAGVDGPAFLVGMDTPQLTPAMLSVDLQPGGAVLGLADDGGFWGIGMHDPDPTVFDGVPMSTTRTGAAQLDRLTQAGLSVTALQRLTDVDTIADARRVALSCPGSRFAWALARIDHPTDLKRLRRRLAHRPATAPGGT